MNKDINRLTVQTIAVVGKIYLLKYEVKENAIQIKKHKDLGCLTRSDQRRK